jgi:hypothetical protein
MLLHASSNASGSYFGQMFSGSDALMNSVWLGVAFIIKDILMRVFAGRELGRKPEVDVETAAAKQPVFAR